MSTRLSFFFYFAFVLFLLLRCSDRYLANGEKEKKLQGMASRRCHRQMHEIWSVLRVQWTTSIFELCKIRNINVFFFWVWRLTSGFLFIEHLIIFKVKKMICVRIARTLFGILINARLLTTRAYCLTQMIYPLNECNG